MKLWGKILVNGFKKEVSVRISSVLLLCLLLTLVFLALPSPLNSAPIQNLDLLHYKIPELTGQMSVFLLIHVASSLLSTPPISKSAASPLACCDLDEDPIASHNAGLR